MSKNKFINLETIAVREIYSSEDGKEIPVPRKPKIDESSPRDVIKYKDRVFEVPAEMIYYLANLPENLSARIKRTKKNGMRFMYPDAGFACHYCSYHEFNPIERVIRTGKTVVGSTGGKAGIFVPGCNYKRAEDVRWATEFANEETGEVVIAQKTPCVVYDSMIAVLVKKGLLDEYEVKGREFNFPTLAELIGKPELQEKYELQPKGLFARLRKLIG